jgi:phosphoribosylformimino-5-aminoimidazole carboxamide ribotide isomerase
MRARDAADRIEEQPDVTPVMGTESLRGSNDVAAMRALPPDAYVLSLDFKDDEFTGPVAVLDEPRHWPDNVIVMTLSRVGARLGPAIAEVAAIVSRAGSRRIYAAGGVRDRADIVALHAAGAAGVLVATALHAVTLQAGDLKEIAGL